MPAGQPLTPVRWTKAVSLLVGKIDETFLRFAVEEFQTGLSRHGLLGNCIFWQTNGAGNCHLEPSVSKLVKEEIVCSNNSLYQARLSRGQWVDEHSPGGDHREVL